MGKPTLGQKITQDDLRGCLSVNRIAEAVRRNDRRVTEVQTVADFSFMADLIDRGVMTGYMDQELPLTYPTIGYREDRKTFETARDYGIAATRLFPIPIPEKGEYPPNDPTIYHYDFAVHKYGFQWDLSWEAWLRDQRDLRLLARYPTSWGRSARYTDEYLFTQAWCANAGFFNGGNGNFATLTGPLTIATLQTGVAAIRNIPDPSGNTSVYGGPLYLVVPPALEFTARTICNSAKVVGSDFWGTGAPSPELNPAYGAATVVVNPFLPVLDLVTGNTAWYLFRSPNYADPAVVYGFLLGYENPEIFVKDSDARVLGTGVQDPFSGDFGHDDIAFKIRWTYGVGLGDTSGAYMDDGTTNGR